MEHDSEDYESDNPEIPDLGTVIVYSFASAAATMAGMFASLYVAGWAYEKIEARRARKNEIVTTATDQ